MLFITFSFKMPPILTNQRLGVAINSKNEKKNLRMIMVSTGAPAFIALFLECGAKVGN
jgi:hypothetical protein